MFGKHAAKVQGVIFWPVLKIFYRKVIFEKSFHFKQTKFCDINNIVLFKSTRKVAQKLPPAWI